MLRHFFIYISFFLFLSSFSFSQVIVRNLSWNPVVSTNDVNNKIISVLNFNGALYNENNIPYFYEKILTNNNNVNYSIIYLSFAEVSTEENEVLKNKILNTDFIATIKNGIYRKNNYLTVEVIPLRKNASSGKIEKLTSFSINKTSNINNYSNINKTKSIKSASESVLSSGNWYKVSVNNEGIYKIDEAFLQQLGVDISNIDPRNISVFGHHFGILPEEVSNNSYDDLKELPIYISGESDGVFNDADYILFYASSANTWSYNSSANKFEHVKNIYSDNNYYYINFESGNGKRINNIQSSSNTANYSVNTFDDFYYWNNDKYNIAKTGRTWLGEMFDTKLRYDTTLYIPNINNAEQVFLKASLYAKSSISSYFKIYHNGGLFKNDNIDITPVLNDDIYANNTISSGTFTNSINNEINLSTIYYPTSSSSIGWLDYIEINCRRNLILSANQLIFRDIKSVGVGNVSQFTIQNANLSTNVWKITDPYNINNVIGNFDGNNYTFKLPTDSLETFIAFYGSNFPNPNYVGSVTNQNLHSIGILKSVDMLIVTNKLFASYANELASIHENYSGLNVEVVDIDQIYNEFSCGKQDISAIRNFAKMVYDRHDSDTLKYLLFFGDASYDYKKANTVNTNFIPTYQSKNSFSLIGSYCTDDFFGYLDAGEGLMQNGDIIDIGIGRLPVTTVEEANNTINKIKRYLLIEKPPISQDCSVSQLSVKSLGDWRNTICFIGDDEDNNSYLLAGEELSAIVSNNNKNINLNKIYFDSFKQYSTPGGARYPDANTAINNQVEKGALIINYIGHGGETGLAHERVVEIPDINGWSNKYNMPFFITATCEFTRYDDYERVSGGEYVFLNPDGGGIGLLSSVRAVLASSNLLLNKTFIKKTFIKENNEYLALGDIIRKTKADLGTGSNYLKFILIGDPALKLVYPKYNIITDSINNNSISIQDTLKAFKKIEVKGHIEDNNAQKLTSFNGVLYPTVFDKALEISSLNNDNCCPKDTFKLQKNIIYKGKATIKNGYFTFSFIVPKDINYTYGNGKISYYCENDIEDGTGNFSNFIIGGTSDSFSEDNTPPKIEVYLNDDSFISGSLTDESPTIIAYLEDENGINTTGNGIGHDIVAVLDDDTEKAIVLNDYYEANIDSYQKGMIKYPLSNIEKGTHTLKIKAWDIYNNSNEQIIEFTVAEKLDLSIEHVLNWPNPFTTKTGFQFEHNQPCCYLDVKIEIFTVTGKVVKTIKETVQTNGFIITPIPWDGKDDFGDKLAKGVYIYRITVKNSDGISIDKYEKLYIL